MLDDISPFLFYVPVDVTNFFQNSLDFGDLKSIHTEMQIKKNLKDDLDL